MTQLIRHSEFGYDVMSVSFGAALVYFYLLIVPPFAWAAFRMMEIPIGLLQRVLAIG